MRQVRIVALVYGALYCLFVVAAALPSTRASIFSNTTLPSFRLEQSLTYLLFAVFVSGLVAL